MGSDENAAGVKVDHELPGLNRSFVNRRPCPVAAHRVDEDVDAAEVSRGCLYDRIHFRRISEVGTAAHEARIIVNEVGKELAQ